MRAHYLEVVRKLVRGPVGAARQTAPLDTFLTLNAGYFLGEWLAPRTHNRLMERLFAWLLPATIEATALAVPPDPVAAARLAQHVREILAAFPEEPELDSVFAELVRATEGVVPREPEDWDASMRAAATAVRAGGDEALLLHAHARRRLWALAQPSAPATIVPRSLARVLRRLARAELTASPGQISARRIQLVEVVVAELAEAPWLAPDLAQLASRELGRPARRTSASGLGGMASVG